MFRADAGARAALIALSVMLAPAVQAQGFGGSFDAPAPVQQTPQPTPQPAPGGNSFGGSFDNGGGFGNSPAPESQPQPQPSVPGGDNFSGGSFGNDEQPVIQPQPQPPVVNNQPQPQPPVVNNQPQPQPPVVNNQPQGPNIDPQILAFETRDYGVPPTNQLRQGPMHAPTPTSIPGATTVTTATLAGAITAGQQMLLIDVLGGQYSLPRALVAQPLSSPGSFNDRLQQQAAQWLGQITGGQRELPIVVFCSDPNCWLSYNATLRVVAAGFTNVYWYRGGLQAWQMAGLQMMPSGF